MTGPVGCTLQGRFITGLVWGARPDGPATGAADRTLYMADGRLADA